MTENGAHLTTSRVNRLLRPLRNKCNSLAALSKPATVTRATYSKHWSSWDTGSRPPLVVFCRSVGTKKLTLERYSADEFELVRRIYSVCDAFKNIVHVAYGQTYNERIPSLSAMCTLVVGMHMPAEYTDGPASADSDSDTTPETGILDGDGIYDAVPPHYRRFLIVSHALSIILCICAHHYTLVLVLFDHCLSSGLVHESIRLLNIIISQAFLPFNPSISPPVTHPAHTSYLVDLHAKWTAENKPSGTSLFTTSAFCRVVLDILSRSTSCNSHILWTSKALDIFFHAVQGCDIDSYIAIIHTLSQSFSETSGSSLDPQDDPRLLALMNKLCELMLNLFDLLFLRHDPHSSFLTPSRINTVIDILNRCHAAQLHRLRTPASGSPVDLPDIIIVFATHIYVTFRSSIDHFDRLLSILDDSSPAPGAPTTFSKLVVYFCRLQGRQPSGDFIEAFLSELEVYSSVFRSEKLFALDASMWACALHHFETSIANSQKGSSTSTRYKQRLMEEVDAAERRCFGSHVISSPIVSSVRSTRTKRTYRGRPSGRWEWEEMVDSWIQKTPTHKKRKTDVDFLLTPSHHNHSRAQGVITSGSIPDSTPLSICHRRSSTISPSRSSHLSESEYRTEDGSDYREESDKENYPSSLVPVTKTKASNRVKRRSSNFSSLVGDAQTNRIVLHLKRRHKPRPSRSIIPEKYMLPISQESRNLPPKQEHRKVSPPLGNLLPSDDSLNLFALSTSSPLRC